MQAFLRLRHCCGLHGSFGLRTNAGISPSATLLWSSRQLRAANECRHFSVCDIVVVFTAASGCERMQAFLRLRHCCGLHGSFGLRTNACISPSATLLWPSRQLRAANECMHFSVCDIVVAFTAAS